MATRRSISVTLVLALAGVLLLLQSSFVAAKGGPTILEWQTMVGVPQAFTGTTNQAVIRGVPGGGIPWRLDLGKGELSRNGHLEIKVRGLVLASGANAGTNPVDTFRGLVSCLTDQCDRRQRPNRQLPRQHGAGERRRRQRRHRGRPQPAEPMHRTDRVRHERRRLLVRSHRRLTSPSSGMPARSG